jgi:hypothetical protein
LLKSENVIADSLMQRQLKFEMERKALAVIMLTVNQHGCSGELRK